MSQTNNETLVNYSTTKRFKSHSSLGKTSLIRSTCRICLSSIFDPACLTCGHTFCEKCLEQYWHTREEPDFIVCPLCRNFAFDVAFAKKADVSSTEEFRKTFTTSSIENTNNVDMNNVTLFCLKMSILMPVLYYFVKWLQPSFVNLLTILRLELKWF